MSDGQPESLIAGVESEQQSGQLEVGQTLEDGTVVGEDAVAAQEAERVAEEGEPDPLEGIDERFHVKGEDGEINWQEMAQKLGKSWAHADKKLKERSEKAPDEYDSDVVPEGLEVGEETLKSFKEWNMTNEQAKNVLAMIQDSVMPQLVEARIEAETGKLQRDWNLEGDENKASFDQRLQTVGQWAMKEYGEEAAVQMASSAAGVKALEAAMRASIKDGSVNLGGESERTSGDLQAELDALIAQPEYHDSMSAKGKVLRAKAQQLAARI